MFRAWSEELPPGIQVCPVQLPGRQARLAEPPYTSLPLLVTDLAQVLLPYRDSPFALFGHSMGTLISFELARQLRRQGAPEPSLLFAASCRAPTCAGYPNKHMS
jgi:medium-chain acyl-[acyl-carrier-protein] hydrolase